MKLKSYAQRISVVNEFEDYLREIPLCLCKGKGKKFTKTISGFVEIRLLLFFADRVRIGLGLG